MRNPVRVFLSAVFVLVTVTASSSAAHVITIDIGPIATLASGGKAVTVSVDVSCPARPSDGIMESRLEVRQERRGTLVVAVAGAGLTCDGATHSYQITAPVQEPTHSFGFGPAAANMFVLLCNSTGSNCLQGDVTESVAIVGTR